RYILMHLDARVFIYFTPFSCTLFLFSAPSTLDLSRFCVYSASPNYESLAKNNPNLTQQAFNNYQSAYTTAWQLEQYARAAEALEKLIVFYRSQKQIDAALETSQILIQTQTLASNFYGLMSAYQKIGELYLEIQKYPQALTAFQQGLKIAQELKHQETYFSQQIQNLKTAPTP
ncbi:MAG: tetratricopeptide repeat protein, partial [Cuspidothrix sp.]